MKLLNIILLIIVLIFFVSVLKKSEWVDDMWPEIELEWFWG